MAGGVHRVNSENMSARKIQIGQLWKKESTGDIYLVTRLYSEALNTMVILRKSGALLLFSALTAPAENHHFAESRSMTQFSCPNLSENSRSAFRSRHHDINKPRVRRNRNGGK